MEIIQTYMSEETEICVISDGNNIHLADKADLTVEDPKVGTKLLQSQMSEVYLEIPIDVLQEAARRSNVYVEADPEEEEEESSDEEGDEEDEEAELPPWEPLAREKFFEEYKALDEGVDVRVLINFPVKVSWEEAEASTWKTTDGVYDLGDVLEANESLQSATAAMTQRIQTISRDMDAFAKAQVELGHELGEDAVEKFLSDELDKLKAEQVANAAE